MRARRAYKSYVLSGLLAVALWVLINPSKESGSIDDSGPGQRTEPLPIHSPLMKAQLPQKNLRSNNETSLNTPPRLQPSPLSRPKKEDLSWFYEPQSQFEREFSLSNPRYDGVLLAEAEHRRDHANSWREKTFKSFNISDLFSCKLRPLSDPLRPIEFKLKLRRNEERTGFQPEWIQFEDNDQRETVQRYEKFISKYSEQEIYIGLLTFPYDSFWRKIDPKSQCDEITLIYDSLNSHEDIDIVTGFSGRVFCRTGLRNLRGIAHFFSEIIQ